MRNLSVCDGAVGLIKVVIIVATTLLLIMLAFVYLARSRSSARRICCNCNLKQVGLSARMWSNEHGDEFPWNVPIGSNGVKEFAMSGNVAALFRAMSNELNSAKVLACPSDKTRRKESEFGRLSNTNVSYFIGLDADETKPQTILSGDRNISGGILTSNRIMQAWGTNVLTWGADMHGHMGNVGLGDGSVSQGYDNFLQNQTVAHLLSFGSGPSSQRVRFALP